METTLNKLYDRLYGGIRRFAATGANQPPEKNRDERDEEIRALGRRKYESEVVRIRNEIKSAKLYGKHCWLVKQVVYFDALADVVNEPESEVRKVTTLQGRVVELLFVVKA